MRNKKEEKYGFAQQPEKDGEQEIARGSRLFKEREDEYDGQSEKENTPEYPYSFFR